MTTKRSEWKSAVARTLRLKSQPEYDNVAERLADGWRKELEAHEIAARLARKLREAEGDASVVEPAPIDLTRICESVGLAVEYAPLAVDAILQDTGSGYRALVNSTHRPARRTMSLAHEIGHLVLYRETGLRQAFGHTLPEERHSSEAQEIEKLCDHFAAEMVLPSKVWEWQLRTGGLSLATLRKLMNCYGITLATAARRTVDVFPYECAVIAWTPVYEDGRLVSVKPVKCWSRPPLKDDLPNDIPAEGGLCVPGSPLHALREKSASFGRLSLDGIEGRFLADSAVIDSKYIATIILPERFGRDVMLGRTPPGV